MFPNRFILGYYEVVSLERKIGILMKKKWDKRGKSFASNCIVKDNMKNILQAQLKWTHPIGA